MYIMNEIISEDNSPYVLMTRKHYTKHYHYMITTASVIDGVQKKWESFKRKDLEHLSEKIEWILFEYGIVELTLNRNKKPLQYKKYVDIIFPYQKRKTENAQFSPIPECYFRYINSYEIEIFSIETDILIQKKSDYFIEFFAYKAATIDVNKLPDFLEYHLNHSFSANAEKYEQFIDLLYAEFTHVLGTRAEVIKKLRVNNMQNFIEYEKKTSLKESSRNIPKSLDQNALLGDETQFFKKIAINAFLEIEIRLCEEKFLNSDGVWQKQKKDLVGLIYFLRDYGYLKKIGNNINKINIRPYRSFFENRYKINLLEMAKPSKFDYSKEKKKVKADYYFISEFKLPEE